MANTGLRKLHLVKQENITLFRVDGENDNPTV